MATTEPRILHRPTLRVSVFNSEEVRNALSGGADAIDCEDPRAAVGMFEPGVVTAICQAIRQSTASMIRTSANIGFNLTLYQKVKRGRAAPRSTLEIQAKAAQSAVGLASAMDVGDGRPNVIKFGVDGLRAEQIVPVASAVVKSIKSSRQYANHQVIGAFLVNDTEAWNRRKHNRLVITELLEAGEFFFDVAGSIDLKHYFSGTKLQHLLQGQRSSKVRIPEPTIPSALGMPTDLEHRTRAYVELMQKAGADGVMIDTPIQAKAARICLLDLPQNASAIELVPSGIYRLEVLRRFSDYCAFLNLEAWLAGSIEGYHAAQLVRLPNVSCIVCRGAVSESVRSPYGLGSGSTRVLRRVTSEKVESFRQTMDRGCDS